MLSQSLKDLWYVAWAPALRANFYRHRLLNGHPDENIKLNIGCGTTRFRGWINIDGNFLQRPDMWLDVRVGLPFRSNSVKVIYSCHFFEHLYLRELKPLLGECRRVLHSVGALRIAVPNLRSAIVAYQRAEAAWFSPFPTNFTSLGGRFYNDMLCDDQHRIMFDFDFLAEVLNEAGFSNVCEVRRGESRILDEDDEALKLERAGDSGKAPDPWLLVEAKTSLAS